MSYDISSYTNSRPMGDTGAAIVGSGSRNNNQTGSDSTITTASNSNSNSYMSTSHSAGQQQQLEQQQQIKRESRKAMERYQQYLQKQAMQQPVYQGIADPLQPNLQRMMQQQNNPPTSIEVVNNANAAPTIITTTTATNANHDNNNRNTNNLSPAGIPDEEPRRGSKVLRVDFAGGITNGDNEEVANHAIVGQSLRSMGTVELGNHFYPATISTTQPTTSNPTNTSSSPRTMVRKLHAWSGSDTSSSRPNYTTTTTTTTTTANSGAHNNTNHRAPDAFNKPPKPQRDLSKTFKFNPDVLVGVHGNMAIDANNNRSSPILPQQPATATNTTILNRNSSDSTGSSSTLNSFGKTPTLAMFYPSPARTAVTCNSTNSTTDSFMNIATNKNTRTYQMEQQQQQQETVPPNSQKPHTVRFGDMPSSTSESSEELKIARLDAGTAQPPRTLRTVPEQQRPDTSQHPSKSVLRQTNSGGTSGGGGGNSSSSLVRERKQEKAKQHQSARPPPPPPPKEPKLTYWQKQQERLEEWWRKPSKYRYLKLLQALFGIYIILMTFTYVGTLGNVGGLVDPETGFIIDISSEENTENGVILVNGDYRAVVAKSTFQMVALAISRLSAFTMYPALVVVFFSKLRGTTNLLSHTYLGQLFIASDLHDLHVYCGHYILIDGIFHTFFHMARWFAQGNLVRLLFSNPSGISGLIVILSTLLICLPMMYGKRKVAYEVRKGFHYLFLIFAMAMCFHVPTSGIPNGGFAPYVFGTLLIWWILDSLFVQWFLTEKIQSSRFYVLPSGVQLTMAVSQRFQSWGTGGYCYVCLPWVNPYQWHAFSLFENPTEPQERQIFFQKLGNWTTQVHSMLGRDTSRPVWISGPFTSPYGNADNYDNQILVAGGIGITPALSVIRQLRDTRRCNLIWATRDRHMLEFFIKHADLSQKGWNMVFYTGKEQLLGIEDVVVTGTGATIHIIRARPKLHFVIPNIIYGIESGTSMPEQFIPDDKIVAMELLQEKLMELEAEPDLDSHEKLSEIVNYCDELGYLFSDLISTLPNYQELTKAPSLASMTGEGDKRMSNRSVLDAILNFNNGGGMDVSTRSEGSPELMDRRNMLARRKSGSQRNLLHNATKLGGAGLRRRRASLMSPSTGAGKRESIATASWGALTATLQGTIKGLGSLDSLDEECEESDEESPPMPSLFDQMEIPFKPWEYNKEAEEFVQKMGEDELKTWGVLYCGGKSPLYKALGRAARKAKVEMHEESFAW